MIWKATQGSIDAKQNPNIWQFQATELPLQNIDVYAGSKQPVWKIGSLQSTFRCKSAVRIDSQLVKFENFFNFVQLILASV